MCYTLHYILITLSRKIQMPYEMQGTAIKLFSYVGLLSNYEHQLLVIR
jgi:hypothetical protein